MRTISSSLVFLAFLASGARAEDAPRDRPFPSSEEIRAVIASRLIVPHSGMVIGLIEPAGRRVVAYGESGAPDHRPLDGDTIFQIGSVTKTFTTLLLADMVTRGEVALDDAAQEFVPRGTKLAERGRAITLRDLATHMSGLPSMPSNLPLRGEPDPIAAYTPRDLSRYLETMSLENAPGEKWAYSNLGVSLLGRLLAQHEHTGYEPLLEARVLRPLGLHSTAITLTRAQASRAAPGHDRYGEPAIVWEMKTLQGSGSLRSSANDLLEYLAAMLGYRETPLRKAIDLQLSERSPVRKAQALGWGTAKLDGHEVFVHDGGKPGFRSLLAFDPASKRGIVLLVNARTDERLNVVALWLLAGRALPPVPVAPVPPARLELSRAALRAFEGTYRLEDGRELVVIANHGALVVGQGDEGASRFVASSDQVFLDPSDTTELEFTRDSHGKVTGGQLYESGRAGKSLAATRTGPPR